MRRFSIFIATMVFMLFAATPSAHAIKINSLDCSGIDPTDGNVQDWDNIDFLINNEESVEGTTYYLNSDTDEWETVEPSNWRYSMNMEQQANIQQMKVCNTDRFLLMLRTEQPMMKVYDGENDTYVDFWSGQDSGEEQQGERVPFTLPADYHYWMVWKMQDAEAAGSIIYFAADLTMDEGRTGDFESDIADPVPQLYLYEESNGDLPFEDATFDPFQDTQLTTIETSHDQEEGSECAEGQDGCESQQVQKNDYAFEVSQDITELFTYADFKYGDTINMSAAMYNSDEFSSTSGRSSLSLEDETETQEYTFSKRAVRGLTAVSETGTADSIQLTWKKMKNAKSYQIKLINPDTDEVIQVIKSGKKNTYTFTGLDAGTSYRAVVRAKISKKGAKKNFSAWSSGYKWTTED